MKGGRVDVMLEKGTIEEGTERARAGATETYGEVASEGGRSEEGREERGKEGATERGNEPGRSVGEREQGANEGGKFQGRYSEQDTSQYTVYSIQCTTHRGPCPLVLQKKTVDIVCVVMYCLTSG